MFRKKASDATFGNSRVKPFQYPVPLLFRIKASFSTRDLVYTWLSSIPFSIGLYLLSNSIFAMMFTAIVIWSFILCIGFRRGRTSYVVYGVEFVFLDMYYFVPPDIMERFVDAEVFKKVGPHFDDYYEPYFDLILNRPVVVVLNKEVPGICSDYNLPKNTLGIEPWNTLHSDVMGHELRVYTVCSLFPHRSRERNIQWMRDNGICTL